MLQLRLIGCVYAQRAARRVQPISSCRCRVHSHVIASVLVSSTLTYLVSVFSSTSNTVSVDK